jgi:hypothetical protein
MASVRHISRRIVLAVAILATGLVAIVAMLVIATQTPWFRQWIDGVIESQASERLRGDLIVGRVEGNLLAGIRLHDVKLVQDGREVITVQTLELEYQPERFLARDLALESVVVTRPIVHLRRTDEGLNLARLLEPRSSSGHAGSPLPLAFEHVEVRDGIIAIGNRMDTYRAVDLPERVTDLDAVLAVSWRRDGDGLSLQLEHVSFRTRNPGLQVRGIKGRVTVGDGRVALHDVTLKTQESHLAADGTIASGPSTWLDLDVQSNNFSLSELGSFVPPLQSRTLSPGFAISVAGTPGALGVEGDVRANQGEVKADVMVDAIGPHRSIEGVISTTNLNLDAIDPDLEASDITATGRVDLRFEADSGVSGTYDVEAHELTYGPYHATDVSADGRVDRREITVNARGTAYKGQFRANGTIALPENGDPVTYDLRGGVVGIDLEDASRDLNLPEVRAALSGDRGASSATFDFRVAGGRDGVKTSLDLRELVFAGTIFSGGTAVEIGTSEGRLTYSIDGRVSNLDVAAIGARLGIAELTASRYKSQIDAVVDLAGTGTSLSTLTLNGTATLTNSHLFGGSIPRLFVRAGITAGTGTVSVEGAFSGLDGAIVTGSSQLATSLSGTVDAQISVSDLGRGDFVFDSINGVGRIGLSQSAVRGIPIDSAVVEGHYANGVATLETVEVQGADLKVKASGRLAIDREHSSDLSYYIDTPPLSSVDLIAAPLRGEVIVQGRLTGNVNAFHATGTLSGTDIGYAETSALAGKSAYTVTVPNLEWARARGSATSDLTSVRVGDRTLKEVHATTAYAGGDIVFDARLREADRSLEAGGRLAWHADHQEVHIDRLRLGSGSMEWRLDERTTAAITYGRSALAIENLVLRAGGDGRIAANGAIGPGAAGPLRLRISGVDLAEVDHLLLDARGLEGQLDAAVDVTGPLSAPKVEGNFSLTAGAFGNFTFDAFTGQFDYGRHRLGLDARLVARDGSWLTMDGHLPLTGRTEGGVLELRVQSSPIELALIQGFTDEVTDVTGTVRLDIVASGSYDEPHLLGYADIANGGFTAIAAGAHYTGFDTRVRFERDVVRIEEFQILDDDGDWMTMGGELAFHERQIEGLQIRVQSQAFEVMDNELGEIEVDADLRISGEPNRPRVEGRIELASGTVRVDRILDLTDTTYATQAVSAEPALKPDAGMFRPTIDVRLAVPANLVLTGTDIEAPGGATLPTGLGNLSVTIGGDLRFRKDPGAPFELLGAVRPIRGTYEFQGREFEIQREGSIVFAGTPGIDPMLDLLATRLISGVEARVHIAGTLDTPRLELSSQPPLDEADILSLIVFNRPLNQLGAPEQMSLAQRAAAVAAGFAGSRLAEAIGNALELDIFEIEIAGATMPSVVIGEQFARGVFVKLRQQLGAGAVGSLQLEYEVTDWLRLRSEVAHAQPETRSLFDRSERGAVKLLLTFRY